MLIITKILVNITIQNITLDIDIGDEKNGYKLYKECFL